MKRNPGPVLAGFPRISLTLNLGSLPNLRSLLSSALLDQNHRNDGRFSVEAMLNGECRSIELERAPTEDNSRRGKRAEAVGTLFGQEPSLFLGFLSTRLRRLAHARFDRIFNPASCITLAEVGALLRRHRRDNFIYAYSIIFFLSSCQYKALEQFCIYRGDCTARS